MRLNFLKGQSLQTRILGVVLVSMTLVALPWADEPAGTPSIEHQVKIAFLYNFVKFVD